MKSKTHLSIVFHINLFQSSRVEIKKKIYINVERFATKYKSNPIIATAHNASRYKNSDTWFLTILK